MKGGKINVSVFLHFILYISDRCSFVIMSVCLSYRNLKPSWMRF